MNKRYSQISVQVTDYLSSSDLDGKMYIKHSLHIIEPADAYLSEEHGTGFEAGLEHSEPAGHIYMIKIINPQ